MFEKPHKVGQRVSREIDIYRPNLGEKTGTITRRYSEERQRPRRFYPEMYEVQWDDGKRDEGYLRHGITPIQ